MKLKLPFANPKTPPFGAVMLGVLLVSMCATVNTVNAQAPFSTPFGIQFPQAISSMAIQPDDKILVAGLFATNGFFRFNPDGTPDTSFAPAVTGEVWFLAIQDDRKILVSGSALNVAGSGTTAKLVRLLPDGALDPSFHSEIQGPPNSIAVDSNGSILVGGWFLPLTPDHKSLARLRSDGSLDSSFHFGITNSPFGEYVGDFALLPNGKILVALGQTHYGPSLCRLNSDGSVDADFNGQASEPKALLPQPNNQSLVLQWFGISRITSDGSADLNFKGIANEMVSLAPQADGRILGHGRFSLQPSVYTSPLLSRLNSDGSMDTTFRKPPLSVAFGSVLLQRDGSILLGSGLGGRTNITFARFRNPEPATELLGISNSSIFWERGGSGPEIWRATFERSTNGLDWVALGQGTRTQQGWKLENVNIAPEDAVRARGYVRSVSFSAMPISEWYLESTGMIGTPRILSGPINETNHLGSESAFGVSVSGALPMHFQWRKDGVEISEATTNVLRFPSLQLSDTAGYSVVITNAYGSITSAVAQLEVLLTPSIVQQPFNRATVAGSTVSFDVSADGAPPLRYQWLKDDVEMPSQTNQVLTLANVATNDVAQYRVRVSNEYGTELSRAATLTLRPYPTIGINSDLWIGFGGQDGNRLVVEASTNLIHWSTVVDRTTPLGTYQSGITEKLDTNVPKRFYRVRQE